MIKIPIDSIILKIQFVNNEIVNERDITNIELVLKETICIIKKEFLYEYIIHPTYICNERIVILLFHVR